MLRHEKNRPIFWYLRGFILVKFSEVRLNSSRLVGQYSLRRPGGGRWFPEHPVPRLPARTCRARTSSPGDAGLESVVGALAGNVEARCMLTPLHVEESRRGDGSSTGELASKARLRLHMS